MCKLVAHRVFFVLAALASRVKPRSLSRTTRECPEACEEFACCAAKVRASGALASDEDAVVCPCVCCDRGAEHREALDLLCFAQQPSFVLLCMAAFAAELAEAQLLLGTAAFVGVFESCDDTHLDLGFLFGSRLSRFEFFLMKRGVAQIHIDAVDTRLGFVARVKNTYTSVWIDTFDESYVCEGVIIEAAVLVAVDRTMPKDEVTGGRCATVHKAMRFDVVVQQVGATTCTYARDIKQVDAKVCVYTSNPTRAVVAVADRASMSR